MSTVFDRILDLRDLLNAPSEHDPEDRSPLGLGLSGGGYRAMVFHLGALWRLNQFGLLARLDRISSVSGGSILAAQLGLHWDRLDFSGGVASNFVAEIVEPIRRLASRTIDVPAVLLGWLGLTTTRFYRWFLYGNSTLQDLPARPLIVINATNVQSGKLWRFSRPYARDWLVGKIASPRIPLCRAVAASTAAPPFLSPVVMHFKESQFVPGSGDPQHGLQHAPYTTRVVLTDGGVYDNLGLESVWKQSQSVLISDGSAQFAPQPRPAMNWFGHALRVVPMLLTQVGSLRKRKLIASFTSDAPEFRREGTYWGLGSHIKDYPVDPVLPCPPERTGELAALPTRLERMQADMQERLINWGYAICDAGVRSHVLLGAPMGEFPYRRGV